MKNPQELNTSIFNERYYWQEAMQNRQKQFDALCTVYEQMHDPNNLVATPTLFEKRLAKLPKEYILDFYKHVIHYKMEVEDDLNAAFLNFEVKKTKSSNAKT